MIRRILNEAGDPYKYYTDGAPIVERVTLSHVYIMMTYPIFAQEDWVDKRGMVGNSVKIPVRTIDKYLNDNKIQPQDVTEDDLKNITKELMKACPNSVTDKNETLDQLKKSLEITLKIIKNKSAVKRLFNSCDEMMNMATDKNGYIQLQQGGGPEVKGIETVTASSSANESANADDFKLKKIRFK